MSILEDFYYGNLDPAEQFVKNGSEYQKLSEKLSADIDDLFLKLNNDEKNLCKKIYNILSEINCISEKEQFISGFRIGAQMAWDILSYDSPNFR